MLKRALLFLVLIFPLSSYCADYYFYRGEKIFLEARHDRIALILKSDFSESYVRDRISPLTGFGDEVKKTGAGVCLINFPSPKTESKLRRLIEMMDARKDIVKLATVVYYGTSKQVTQVPTGRFIVRLKNPADKDKLDILNIENDCSVAGRIGDDRGYIIESGLLVTKNSLELSEIYYSKGIFEYAEPDFLYPDKCILMSIPNDQYFPLQWALNNTGQLIQTGSPFSAYGDAPSVNGVADADMDVAEAWDYTTGSGNVKVAVIDTGIDSLHPDFQAAGHLLPGYDAYNNVNSSAVDIGNHGTSTAGQIGAVMNNSIGISGISPGCRLMSINIFDTDGNTTSSIIARAFDTALVRGIDVLSNSWGGMTPVATVTNAINNSAFNGRGGLGTVILFASGNDGRNPPIYPSVLPNVLSVGASTPHDQKKAPGTGNQFYWGSNYGEDQTGDLDLTTPTNCYTLKAGGYEPNFWGTSATCPNAAGVAALVLSVNQSQTRLQVYDNLARGCDKTGNVEYSVDKPFGKWNPYLGYGRVNAYNSVRLAAGADVTPPAISHKCVSSHSSTYPTSVNAVITDQDGSPVPAAGLHAPKLFFRIKKNAGSWSGFDSLNASSVSGNMFTFKIPSQGWETEVQYYIRASDNSGNETTFPKHAPDPFWLCYFAVGKIESDTKKIPQFAGADYGATLSPVVTFGSFKVIGTKIKINMRHTYLDDEVIQIYSPSPDPNNSRKCLFSSNGGDLDNIYGAVVSDSADQFWKDGSPPYYNGYFKPDYTMSGFNGINAGGNWRILHFDRAIGDNANFDSVKITLYKTSGLTSSSVRLNSPEDSVINFGSVSFPNVYDRNFYVKNSGTASLAITGSSFEGSFASMFSIVNQPPASVPPNDSGLFVVRLNTAAGNGINSSVEDATLKIQTNDPSKNIFRVSLITSDSLRYGLKRLQLTALIQGFYKPSADTTIRDSITVYVRKAAAPYSILDSSKVRFDAAGMMTCIFSNTGNDTSCFISLRHRNALETWSAGPVSFVNATVSYDLTSGAAQAYGNNLILRGAKYCLYSGDVDQNGTIDASDISRVDNLAANFGTGYLPEDVNGDMIVDALDIMITDNNSLHFVTLIRP